MGLLAGAAAAWLRTSLELLGRVGPRALQRRAADQAERLADLLEERGLEPLARGRSTLVSWRSSDSLGDVERLAAAGVAVRDLPGRGLVRASVGAWTSDDDLERLLAVASPSTSSR